MLTANVTEDSPSGSPRGKMILQMSRDGEALYGSWISEVNHVDHALVCIRYSDPTHRKNFILSVSFLLFSRHVILLISQNSKRLFHLHFNRPVAPPRFPLSQIFFAGQYGYDCHRVPAAIKTSNGHILVFVESRRTSCNDQAPKDVNMRRHERA